MVSLYGLKQSARAWNRVASDALRRIGFARSGANPCLYVRWESDQPVYVLLYVDDMLVAGRTHKMTANVGEQLQRFFELRDLGPVRHYQGIQVEQGEDGSYQLWQSNKITQLLVEHGMEDSKSVETPMVTGFLTAPAEESPLLPNNNKYRQLIGSLLYLATVSRPDIALAVGVLARRVAGPMESDWKAAKRVLRYLGGTLDRRLTFPVGSDTRLGCWVDADWAGEDLDRSTSGCLFRIGPSLVSWKSKKQVLVATSSTEAEYVAASSACNNLQWMRQLLADLGVSQKGPTTVYEDSQGCIKLVQADVCSQRTRHIDIRHHQIRVLRELGYLTLKYCDTDSMTADILTKPLSREKFRRLVYLLE